MPVLDTKGYWNTRLTKEWGLRGVGYYSLGQGFNEWMYKLRRKAFERTAPYVRTALDIGSGTGFYVALWKARGTNVMASDLAPFAVQKLKERYDAMELDITTAKPEGTFDAVSAFDVLFHIVDDAKFDAALGNIAACLLPGGVFLYSENLPAKTVRYAHQVSRSGSDVLAHLEKQGFVVERIYPVFHLMNAPVASENGMLKFYWRLISLLAPSCGWLLGALLYPVELMLLGRGKGPSTKILVCRKR